jgi:hypothetical protein
MIIIVIIIMLWSDDDYYDVVFKTREGVFYHI